MKRKTPKQEAAQMREHFLGPWGALPIFWVQERAIGNGIDSRNLV